jgi:hypothetical protein
MRSEFEEKTYEQHLTSELVHARRLFFPPGQVLEDIVGFDVALRTSNRTFWALFPHMYPAWRAMLFLAPSGAQLNGRWWHELEREVEYFPKFKFNCFVQAKRPDRMVRSDAAEFSCWNRPYFRYETFPSQQRALESLAQKVSGKAVVVYACPAFHTYSELWAAIRAAQLVKQSNFCEVAQLSGHSRYSYTGSGNTGFRHSDPEPVQSTPFEEALEALENQDPAQSNLTFLTDTAEVMDSAAKELGDLYEASSSVVSKLFQDMDSRLAKSLARIYAFQLICNVRLLIGYEG